MTIIAIDPGSVSGAFAIVNGSVSEVHDIPVVDKQIDAAGFARLVRDHNPSIAIVERVGAMPKQGVSSTFRFGVAVGIIHGVLAGAGVPMHLVTPTVWKRAFKLLGTDKEASRALAIRLYPKVVGLSRKRDQGRAEALLMAHWQRHGGLT